MFIRQNRFEEAILLGNTKKQLELRIKKFDIHYKESLNGAPIEREFIIIRLEIKSFQVLFCFYYYLLIVVLV